MPKQSGEAGNSPKRKKVKDMTFTEIALSALNSTTGRVVMGQTVTRLCERFDLVWVEYLREFHRQDDCVMLENGSYAHSDHVFCCDLCSVNELDTLMRRAYGVRRRGLSVCPACADDECWWCCDCGNAFVNDVSSCDADGDMVCSECYESREESACDDEDEDVSANLPEYHKAVRWSRPFSMPNQAYSIEWEVEIEDRQRALDVLYKNSLPLVSWERDGSLDSRKGVEILVQWSPTLDDALERMAKIKEVFKSGGFHVTSWDNGRCGIHVNSCSRRFNSVQMKRLLYAALVNREMLYQIAGRECHWAVFPSLGQKSVLSDWLCGYFGKYTAISPKFHCIEWRLFKGTMNLHRIKMYFESVKFLEDLALGKTKAVDLASTAKDGLRRIYQSFVRDKDARINGKGGK